MLELSSKTNLLEEHNYMYSLQDVEDPVLYRDVYNYEEIPKIPFNHRRVPMSMPEEIWITDTSFRDGQQSVNPYTVEQIVKTIVIKEFKTNLLLAFLATIQHKIHCLNSKNS